MAQRIISSGTLHYPATDLPWPNATVLLLQTRAFVAGGVTYPQRAHSLTTDSSGILPSLTIAVPDEGTMTWRIILPDRSVYAVPIGAGIPISLESLLLMAGLEAEGVSAAQQLLTLHAALRGAVGTFGHVAPDGVTITSAGGVLSAVGGVAAAHAATHAAAGSDPLTLAQSQITGLVDALAARQPLDTDLTALAALTTTSYGRGLLELADAAALRTAAGLGSAATQASTAFAPARHTTAQTLTDASTVAWDTASGHLASVTLGGNRTLGAPTNGTPGTYILRVTQDGTGSRTLAYNAAFKWPGGAAPVLSTAAGAVDVLTFVSYDGAVFYGAIQKAF